MSNPSSTDARADLTESLEAALYAAYLEPTEDPAARLEELCTAHPNQAKAMRRQWQRLTRGGGAVDEVRQEIAGEEAPATIGPFTILGTLGRGAFGTVYRAEQSVPVARVVALKVLHAHKVEAAAYRFSAELQILAGLEHPGIARVLDAGELPDRRPWYSMELVEGTPITTYCDAKELTVPERLRLFRQVCDAVHHAHQRGVVHRDIKPHNVLVQGEKSRPQPKLLDFGVAKILEDNPLRVTAASIAATNAGAMVGTPQYMSPEQAAGSEVDTRTDVYGLGVLLFEMLTGELPFDRASMTSKNLAELVDIICNRAPMRPSEAIARGGSDLHAVARARSTDTRGLHKLLRGDLQWVLVAALAKAPDDRHPSAAALSEDIGRVLSRSPVSVRRAAMPYLLAKFVSRHRTAVLVASCFLLLGVLGLIGLAYSVVTIGAERDRANDAVVTIGQERDRADSAVNRASQTNYAMRMQLAGTALARGNPKMLQEHLREAPPELRGWEWRHLAWRAGAAELVTEWKGQILRDLSLDPQGKWIAITGNYSIAVLSTETSDVLAKRRNLVGSHCQLATLPDGRLLAGGASGRLLVLDPLSLEIVLELAKAGEPPIQSVSCTADGMQICAGDSQGGFRTWSMREDPPHRSERVQAHERSAVARFVPGVARIVTCGTSDHGSDGKIKWWDLEPLRLVREIETHLDPRDVVIDEGGVVYTATHEGDVIAYSSETGEQLWSTSVSDGRALRLHLSPPSRLAVATGFARGAVIVLDSQNGAILHALHSHEAGVNAVTQESDSLWSVGRDGRLCRWSLTTIRDPLEQPIGRGMNCVRFDAAGKQLAAASWKRLSLFKLDDTLELLATRNTESSIRHLGWSASGQDIIVASSNRLRAFDRQSLTPRPLVTPKLRYTSFEAIRDGYVIGTPNSQALLLRGEPLMVEQTFDVGRGLVGVASHRESGRFAAVANGELCVRDAQGKVLRRIEFPAASMTLPAFSSDGKHLAVGRYSGHMRVIEIETGHVTYEVDLPALAGIAWSPDDLRIATGGVGAVTLHDPWRGSVIVSLKVDHEMAYNPAFDPSGEWLACLAGRLRHEAYLVLFRAPPDVVETR